MAAAHADGVAVDDDGQQKLNGYDGYDATQIPSRRGKWTVEEEDYANRLIHEFKEGRLPLSEGTTLRTFLSKVLNCDPMRISKKFVGANSIGKQIFRRKRAVGTSGATDPQTERMNDELATLEKRFLERVSMAKSKSRSGRSSSGNGGSGETSTGRQASNRQHADYDYGDRDDDTDYEEGGASGRRVRRKVDNRNNRGGARNNAAASAAQQEMMDPYHQGSMRGYGQPTQHVMPTIGMSMLKPVTSLEFLAMDGPQATSYQAQLQMKYQSHDTLSSPSQTAGLPMDSIRSPEGRKSGLGSNNWPSVQNLLEASSMIHEGTHGNGRDKAGGSSSGSGSGSSSGSSSGSGGGGENILEPPAYRDLAGMGSMKRSTAHEQLEKSNSSNNLGALANASHNHSSTSSSSGGNSEYAVAQEEQSRSRSDSIVKFQSQVTGPDMPTNSPLKKGTASIQNFMFLVENGDLPPPEKNVLMEPLVKSNSRTSQGPPSQLQQGAGGAANGR